MARGKERMFANYVKIRPPMEIYQRGLVEFDAETRELPEGRRVPHGPGHLPRRASRRPPFLHRDGGVDYIYYCSPYPLVRIPADPEALADPVGCEAFTCLAPGTRLDQQKLDRGADGRLRYAWKTQTQLVSQDQQAKLVDRGPAQGRTRRCSTSATS